MRLILKLKLPNFNNITGIYVLLAHLQTSIFSELKNSSNLAYYTFKAHHHVPFSIWGDEAMTICWLWSERSKKCDWNGGEYIANEATMIRCNPSPGFKLLIDTGKSCTFNKDLKILYYPKRYYFR